MEKECRIRKTISRYLNKREEDFPSLRAYNDYLEEVEDIIFKLFNDVDVQQTFDRLEKFKIENRDLISKNATRQSEEEKEFRALIQSEERRRQEKMNETLVEMQEEELGRKRQRLNLIEELANSDKPAVAIISNTKKLAKSSKQASLFDDLNSSISALNRHTLSSKEVEKFDPFENCHLRPSKVSLLDSYFDQ